MFQGRVAILMSRFLGLDRGGMRPHALASFVLVFALLSSPAGASEGEARICRGKLTPVGQQMYDLVAPHVRANSRLSDLMRKHVRSLVMSGRISLKEAQASGPAVGACLRQLQT